MIELPIRDLSRNQRKRVQDTDGHRFAKAINNVAEEVVAEEYDVSTFTDAEWYDCVDKDSGTKYEVKSTSSRIGDDYPAKGRFRLWKAQHLSLAISEGQNMAWYAFVFLDESTGTLKIQRRKPTTVTKIVNERGGWYDSGHSSKGKQYKLPVSEVF